MTDTPTETDADDVSPAMAALRAECGILHNIFGVLGQATIRAHECRRAAEVLDYIQGKIDYFEAAIADQEALEPKAPDNGDGPTAPVVLDKAAVSH